MHIHNVFHTSLLKPHIANTFPNRIPPIATPDIIDDVSHFEVEIILDSSIKYNELWYLVQWKDLPISERSWEHVSEMQNCPEAVTTFHISNPMKPSQVTQDNQRTLRPTPKKRSILSYICNLP